MVWATPCRELQLTEKVRVRAKSLIGSIPNAEDMLESIANAIPVEGMESLLPALVDDMEPVQGMLPKRALVMLSDPEKLRRAADDLAKTANEFLAASWHVAASGHGAGAPITFDQAYFYDFEETISSLVFSRHDVWKLTSFGVDSSREGRVQLDAPILENIAEMRPRQLPVSKVFLMPAMPSPSLQERKALLFDSNVPSTKRESPTSTASDRVPSTDSSIMPRKSHCLPNAT